MKVEEILTPDEVLEGKIDRIHRKREWRRFWIECVLMFVVLYFLFHNIIGIAFVSGHSMEPTLKDGELLLFYRLDKEYQTGDLIIVRREEDVEYIKRVVADGQDRIELDEDGIVWINGEQEQGSYLYAQTYPISDQIVFPYEVPEDSYFVMGDNRENSKDSRMFGAVSSDEITGRVFFHMGMVH